MPAIRTASELGLAIRSRRKEMGLDQAELARRVGVTRQWVIDIEKGKPRAELELVMRALHALELTLLIETQGQRRNESSEQHDLMVPSIESVFSRLGTPRVTSSPSIIESFRQGVATRRDSGMSQLHFDKNVSVSRAPRTRKKKDV
jgi:HTH-type transcriptional regulator/antitoxin HipB